MWLFPGFWQTKQCFTDLLAEFCEQYSVQVLLLLDEDTV